MPRLQCRIEVRGGEGGRRNAIESDAYPFTPKTYPIDMGSTIDIGRLVRARNGQVAAAVDCLDGRGPLCKAQ
jgi:hypothetical protein